MVLQVEVRERKECGPFPLLNTKEKGNDEKVEGIYVTLKSGKLATRKKNLNSQLLVNQL